MVHEGWWTPVRRILRSDEAHKAGRLRLDLSLVIVAIHSPLTDPATIVTFTCITRFHAYRPTLKVRA